MCLSVGPADHSTIRQLPRKSPVQQSSTERHEDFRRAPRARRHRRVRQRRRRVLKPHRYAPQPDRQDVQHWHRPRVEALPRVLIGGDRRHVRCSGVRQLRGRGRAPRRQRGRMHHPEHADPALRQPSDAVLCVRGIRAYCHSGSNDPCSGHPSCGYANACYPNTNHCPASPSASPIDCRANPRACPPKASLLSARNAVATPVKAVML